MPFSLSYSLLAFLLFVFSSSFALFPRISSHLSQTLVAVQSAFTRLINQLETAHQALVELAANHASSHADTLRGISDVFARHSELTSTLSESFGKNVQESEQSVRTGLKQLRDEVR